MAVMSKDLWEIPGSLAVLEIMVSIQILSEHFSIWFDAGKLWQIRDCKGRLVVFTGMRLNRNAQY